MISDEKASFIWITDSLCVVFIWPFQDFFLLVSVLYDESGHGFLQVYLKFVKLLASANICSFIKSGKFSAIISSNKFLHHFFLLTFQDYNNSQVRSSDTVPRFIETLCIFYQTFFLLCFTDWVIFIDLPSSLLILFFLISILLWWLYSGLSISIIVSIHSNFPFGSWYHFCFLPENFYLSIFKRFSLILCISL